MYKFQQRIPINFIKNIKKTSKISYYLYKQPIIPIKILLICTYNRSSTIKIDNQLFHNS